MTTKDQILIRILFIIAKFFTPNDEEIRKELHSLDTHIRVQKVIQ